MRRISYIFVLIATALACVLILACVFLIQKPKFILVPYDELYNNPKKYNNTLVKVRGLYEAWPSENYYLRNLESADDHESGIGMPIIWRSFKFEKFTIVEVYLYCRFIKDSKSVKGGSLSEISRVDILNCRKNDSD